MIISAHPALLFEEFGEVGSLEPVRSPLNYIGGKYKLLPQLLKRFPSEIGVFVDLFCGGCNVGANVRARHVVFNDNLTYLIDLYRAFKEKTVSEILSHVRGRIAEFGLSLANAEGYLKLRKLYNTSRVPLDLFVLVAYSFNHQIRYNSAHQFNNPFGKERSSFNPSMERNLTAFVARLHEISCEFRSYDFESVDLEGLGAADLVYCDPPYLITTGTYNDGKRGFTGWGVKEEETLLSLLDNLNSKGVRFALSNVLRHKGKENVLLKEWAEDNGYCIAHLSKNYANSSYHTIDRSLTSSDEVLITNYPAE